MTETGRCARCVSIGAECPPWRKRSELKREALMKIKPSPATSCEKGGENAEAATSGETNEEPSSEDATRDDTEEGLRAETSSSTGGA
jgi:hypothetical protein